MDLAGAGALLSGLSSFGGLFGGGLSERKQMALQAQYNREVMQNQIQWRAEDARKAGVHPLYAMGAPAVSFSPQSIGTESTASKISTMGQNIGRAAMAYSDSKMRAITDAQQIKSNELDIKAKEIALAKSASDLAISRTGATVPLNSDTLIPGQGNSSIIPSKSVASRLYGVESNMTPGAKFITMPDGGVMPIPGNEINMDADGPYAYENYIRNRIVAPLKWGFSFYSPSAAYETIKKFFPPRAPSTYYSK